MDGNADIIKVFRKFTAPTINREGYYEGEGNYETYFVEGAIDVNNDGYDELIISKSYYEGGGDEIYSFDGESFVRIVSGNFNGS